MRRAEINCKLWITIILVPFFYLPGAAQNLKVAIAANLQPVMKELQKDFKKRTGISVDAISGSSGNLTAQISNGAPYDVFLSADVNFPQTLFKKGVALQKPVVYAFGTLIICSTQNLNFNDVRGLLSGSGISKIAIGNPVIAPYGKAAKQTLTGLGIYNKLRPKIVFGESITQVNTYITTGVVQAGFTTLALVKAPANKTRLYYKLVAPESYQPIKQGMVMLKHAEHNLAAGKFYRYILSVPAKKIFAAYGYHVQ
ncbi:molybdate ABC transporter substrate-binding protein [Mucilaginibacter segetis]|uniref:Molybdate ABC transporter substrate-binding protein n=1 Tax=Mucilaginibacter segetis TaxID=2793071 RepID=A0A934UNA5_9SPHI|nr:molybdate ABC transporter substrate-binding protein [Mucilaginibacter segetis]MBK0379870.1 molybdate ABC transporter substrate-binding protein [Mucilaginibacter segetis]